jgi:hypothetical protein
MLPLRPYIGDQTCSSTSSSLLTHIRAVSLPPALTFASGCISLACEKAGNEERSSRLAVGKQRAQPRTVTLAFCSADTRQLEGPVT